jgi:hypothetical protein
MYLGYDFDEDIWRSDGDPMEIRRSPGQDCACGSADPIRSQTAALAPEDGGAREGDVVVFSDGVGWVFLQNLLKLQTMAFKQNVDHMNHVYVPM